MFRRPVVLILSDKSHKTIIIIGINELLSRISQDKKMEFTKALSMILPNQTPLLGSTAALYHVSKACCFNLSELSINTIPINKRVGTIKQLLEKCISEQNDNGYVLAEDTNLYSKEPTRLLIGINMSYSSSINGIYNLINILLFIFITF